MSRALIIINGPYDRERAIAWIKGAPVGTRVEFKKAKRTIDQNSRFWAMLSDVASQVEHAGQKYTTEEWKLLFMHAWGREVRFLPGLDQKSVVPVGQSSSDLSKEEMGDLMEFMSAWGAEHGVTFHDTGSPDESPLPSDDSGGAVPSSGAAAAVPAAAGLGAGESETRHGAVLSPADEVAMVNDVKPMITEELKAEMVRKVLQMATDGALSAQDKLENLDGARTIWIEQMPGRAALVKQVFDTARKYVNGEIKQADAQKFMESLI